MGIERAIVQGIRPQMMAASARWIMEREMGKGCSPDISRVSVCLEPRYRALSNPRELLQTGQESDCVPGLGLDPERVIRLRLWTGRAQECDWTRSERFIKQLQAITRRVCFEINGNEKGIRLGFLCDADDELVLRAALTGEFSGCDLSRDDHHPFESLSLQTISRLVFRDFFPLPPYSSLFTRSNELFFSPFEPFLNVLAQLPGNTLGFYQAVLEPVSPDHDWHWNVEALTDLRYMAKLLWGSHLPQRNAQQAPSGDLRSMAMEVDTKSHNDKPFFAAAVRVGLLGGSSASRLDMLRALCVFMGLFLHAGQPLASIGEEEYNSVLGPNHIQAMFRCAATHRTGFLVNSAELAGFVHVPAMAWLEERRIHVDLRDAFRRPRDSFQDGTEIGVTVLDGAERIVRIPLPLRSLHTYLIGNPGMGKSSLIRHMSTEEACRGEGVAVLDPHGDLAESILSSLPAECIDRTIYFAPGDPEWIPLWNPLKVRPGQDRSRVANEIVAAIRSIAEGWGDRLAALLQHGLTGAMHLDDATLFDVAMVLKATSTNNRIRREQILRAVESPLDLEFWQNDIKTYGNADFSPAWHKLGKIMASEPVELMFSQPENRIDFRDIMDKGMIFIADLSRLGSESRDVLGRFLLSFIYVAALSRSTSLWNTRRPFHVYADEAQRFVGGNIEDLIAETRKYGVSLTLAHQYLSQFPRQTADALGMVGTMVVYRLQQGDAERMVRVLGAQVSAQDLTLLDARTAIVRIGQDVLRVTTPPYSGNKEPKIREALLERSRQRFCRRAEEIRAENARKMGRTPRTFGHGSSAGPNVEGDFTYAEL